MNLDELNWRHCLEPRTQSKIQATIFVEVTVFDRLTGAELVERYATAIESKFHHIIDGSIHGLDDWYHNLARQCICHTVDPGHRDTMSDQTAQNVEWQCWRE